MSTESWPITSSRLELKWLKVSHLDHLFHLWRAVVQLDHLFKSTATRSLSIKGADWLVWLNNRDLRGKRGGESAEQEGIWRPSPLLCLLSSWAWGHLHHGESYPASWSPWTRSGTTTSATLPCAGGPPLTSRLTRITGRFFGKSSGRFQKFAFSVPNSSLVIADYDWDWWEVWCPIIDRFFMMLIICVA